LYKKIHVVNNFMAQTDTLEYPYTVPVEEQPETAGELRRQRMGGQKAEVKREAEKKVMLDTAQSLGEVARQQSITEAIKQGLAAEWISAIT